MPLKVLVTGASGGTGSFTVLELLKSDTTVEVFAGVRSETGKAALTKLVTDNIEGAIDRLKFVTIDVKDPATLTPAFEGMDVVIICTGAQPQIVKTSLPGFIFRKTVLRQRDARPSFVFPPGNTPVEIDAKGNRDQIDTAAAAGVKHLIICSSQATLPSSADSVTAKFLNGMGGANVLVHKQATDDYLVGHDAVKANKMAYTIVRPGGLLPHRGVALPTDAGVSSVVVTYDDAALDYPTERRMISRAELGRVLADCVKVPAAKNHTFDVTVDSTSTAPYVRDLGAAIAAAKAARAAAVPAAVAATPEPAAAAATPDAQPAAEAAPAVADEPAAKAEPAEQEPAADATDTAADTADAVPAADDAPAGDAAADSAATDDPSAE